MVTSTTIDLFPAELDRRTNDGVDVTLLWRRRTNAITVAVSDAKSGTSCRAGTPRRAQSGA